MGKYALGLGILGAMVWWNWDPPSGNGLKDILSRPLQPTPLAIAFTAIAVGTSLTYFRWYLLVRALDLPFRLADAFRLGLVGSFCSMFLPGAISGDVVRAAFLAREQQRRTAAAATALADRVVGVWGLFWLVTVVGGAAWALGNQAILRAPFLQTAILVASAVIAVSLAVWLIAGLLPDRLAHGAARRLQRIPKVGGILAELWRVGWMYGRRPVTVAAAILLSLANHVCLVMAFYCCGLTILEPAAIPSLAEHFVFIPIGELIQVIPLLPGGVGLAEAGYAALYSLTGIPNGARTGLNVALVFRLVVWAWSLVGYYLYLRMRPAAQAPAQPVAAPEVVEV
jgi:uncharacterized protein (TIRG00374 family)